MESGSDQVDAAEPEIEGGGIESDQTDAAARAEVEEGAVHVDGCALAQRFGRVPVEAVDRLADLQAVVGAEVGDDVDAVGAPELEGCDPEPPVRTSRPAPPFSTSSPPPPPSVSSPRPA